MALLKKWRSFWPQDAIAVGLLLFIAISFGPYLATEAQNPDGLEILMAARYNTLPHPPGNPLYLWLAKLVWRISATPQSLSALSWIFFTAAGMILYFILRQFCPQRWMAFWGTTLWFSFPTAVSLGTSPEKYALLYFIEALFFYGLSKKKFFLICFSLGLMMAHHDTTILLLVILPFSFWPEGNPSSFIGIKKILAGLTLALTMGILAYTSFFGLNQDLPWPNFGPCRNWGELIKFLTFREFGQNEDMVWMAPLIFWQRPFFKTLCRHLAEAWTIGSWFLCLSGILSFKTKVKYHRFAWACGVFTLLGTALLALGNLGDNNYGLGYLARYHTIILMPLIFLIVFGAQEVIKLIPANILQRWKKIIIPALFLLPGQGIYQTHLMLPGHTNQILTTWQNEVGAELRPENIWIEENDYLIFGGVVKENLPTNLGPSAYDLQNRFYDTSKALKLSRRFPLFMVFFLPHNAEAKALYLEPRLQEVWHEFKARPSSLFDLIDYLHAKGYSVQTTGLVSSQNFIQLRQGLTYILPPPDQVSHLMTTEQNLDHYHRWAQNLCQALGHLQGPVPSGQNYFQKDLLKSWQQFFQEYYYRLKLQHGPQNKISAAAKLALIIVPDTEPQEWMKLCQELTKED